MLLRRQYVDLQGGRGRRHFEAGRAARARGVPARANTQGAGAAKLIWLRLRGVSSICRLVVCTILKTNCSRLLLELQVSYDGLKPDGKYSMVFEGQLA